MKPIKSPSRATARLIKKQQNEKNPIRGFFSPSNFSRQAVSKQSRF
jgi:hypothetical protein